MQITLMITTSLFIPIILLFISWTISMKKTNTKETTSPYECGFQPISKQRTNFNIRYFQIAIIFLIFDGEICLLLPTPQSIYSNMSSIILMLFLIITLLGTLFELKIGSLSWLK